MSNLRPQVRSALTSFLTSQDGIHLKTDVLRIIEEEARLMKETERVLEALERDEMDQLGEISRKIERLKKNLRVTSYDSIRALDGYTRIAAVVDVEGGKNLMQLTFKYERKKRIDGANGVHVRYSIEYSTNYQQRENLLVVEVWSPQDGPSPGRAICINQSLVEHDNQDDDDDGWEDIDGDDVPAETGTDQADTVPTTKKNVKQSAMAEDATNKASKRQKLCEGTNGTQSTTDDNTKNEGESTIDHDEYLAYLDPDLMHEFLRMARLEPMEEGTAIFLLMTFPFFDHEWDLVGYLLDEIFGSDDGEEDDDDNNDAAGDDKAAISD
ncbi:hypothetical protein IV203_034527 [Nitzschia inconspicua]|uniref:Uncharacterized protein n=1 Tax=Nitzschia inconspicua TaxID=303405 RepID=A0A9K3K980_9STRA|nr:hypothetical protein IV203_002582 [Nitzschia inconspicua]KAG7359429.1 hypothetical protein IV203_034527 [Nitzschia inconspicua]